MFRFRVQIIKTSLVLSIACVYMFTVEETIMQTYTGVRLFFGTFITVYKYSSCTHVSQFIVIYVIIVKKNLWIFEFFDTVNEGIWFSQAHKLYSFIDLCDISIKIHIVYSINIKLWIFYRSFVYHNFFFLF